MVFRICRARAPDELRRAADRPPANRRHVSIRSSCTAAGPAGARGSPCRAGSRSDRRTLAPGDELRGQLLQDLFLRGPIEVNNHVAAEDHVRLLGHSKVGIHEIQAPKLHLLRATPERRATDPSPGSRLRMKYFRRSSGGTGRTTSALKTPMLRLGQHRGGDVGGEHLESKTGMGLRVFAQHHRQRVRLLAGGAARAPDQRLPALPVALAPASGSAFATRKSKWPGSRKKSVLLVVTTSIRCTSLFLLALRA